jgi:5'-3' exonuclease
VQLDRRSGTVSDEAGVVTRYGVMPESIPDWLALVGDSSDGFPGLAGWGKVAASTVLARYRHLDDIPPEARHWEVAVRGRDRLAATLAGERDLALLFRDLATLRAEAPVLAAVEDLRWQGPAPELAGVAERIRAPGLVARVEAVAGHPVHRHPSATGGASQE